jgi:hypothetical protein
MASIAFPSGLYGFILDSGFAENPPNNLLRTSMDAGPAKVRRRATSGVRVFQFALFLSSTDLATFDTFLITTSKNGSLAFDFRNPRTQVETDYRFVNQPKYTIMNEGYHVACVVEELP